VSRFFSPKMCPRTFLNCFVLDALSSQAKQLRNVFLKALTKDRVEIELAPLQL
jgi:hypothetical protein